MSTGRNEPCPCGSGKKHKHCCLGKADPATAARSKKLALTAVLVVIVAVIIGFAVSTPAGLASGVVGLAAIGIFVWLFAPPPKSSGGANPSAINYGR